MCTYTKPVLFGGHHESLIKELESVPRGKLTPAHSRRKGAGLAVGVGCGVVGRCGVGWGGVLQPRTVIIKQHEKK